MRPAPPRLAALTALALVTAACAGAPERRYEAPPVEPPTAWAAPDPAAGSGRALGERWWSDFGDAGLDAAVEELLRGSLDLRAAAARVEAARAQARVAGALREPTLDASGSALRQRQNFVGLPLPGGGDVLSSTYTSYGVSLDLSWELDLWGRLAAGEAAALADLAAGEADLEAARLSLTGQTAKAWFALAEAELQAELARATAASFRSNTELVRGRYERGRGDALDLRLSESNLASAEALVAQREEVLARTRRQLEILLGRHPDGALAAAADLPAVPPPVPAGLPSELLRRRPDLVAAEARLAAADRRLGAARAALWPSLRLTASAGRSSAELGDLADGDFDVWSLAGGITQPLFQGGRLRAQVDLADARARELLAVWGQELLVAFGEVEAELAVGARLEERERALAVSSEHARAARRLAEERYRAGRGTILAVLEAQRRALAAESEHLAARRARLDARVDLYLALGGGFGAGEEVRTAASTPPADARGDRS